MKIGIIGCGLNSDYHIRFTKSYPGAEIVGLVDLDHERARRVAGQNGIRGAFADLASLVKETGPDVVHILSGKHIHNYSSLDLPIRLQGGKRVPVRIGRGTWIGDRAMVMADIGRECVIGAGSVVTREIEDLSVAAGNRARVIQQRTDLTGRPSD